MQYAIFGLWTIVMVVLFMNLLIAFLSETYTRVYEMRKPAGFTEMAHLILELESLMIWNRGKTDTSHIIYSEIMQEEEGQDDVSVGIGEKISKLKMGIRGQFDQVKHANAKSSERMSSMES
jgi:hypothetical protein